MRNTITAPFKRIMRTQTQAEVYEVHFHTDGAGRAFVCDHPRCESPRLAARELRFTS